MAAALAAAGGVSVAQLTVTIDNPSPSEDVYITVTPEPGSLVTAQTSQDVVAGIYNETIGGKVIPGFCIDVAHDVSVGQVFNNYYYTSIMNAASPPAGPMNGYQAVDIEKLWTAYFSQAQVNSQTAAALQVAIWEELGNGQPLGPGGTGGPGYTVTDGNPTDATTTAVFGQAATMMTSIAAGGSDANVAQASLLAINSTGLGGDGFGQSYVVPVPEPTTLIAGAMLLLPFGASTLRTLRRNRAA